MTFPRTPTERRLVRAEIVAAIMREGLTPEQAKARNAGDGWSVAGLTGYRWSKGEFAVIANALDGSGNGW